MHDRLCRRLAWLGWEAVVDAAKARVVGVVVFYRAGIEAVRNIEVLLEQVAHVIVVDNGSEAGIVSALQDVDERGGRLSIIRNNANQGVAAGLNQGVIEAGAAGADWVATFDQDSRVTYGMIEAMLSAYANASSEGKVGILHPCYADEGTGRVVCLDDSRGRVTTAITSGSLVAREVFQRVGTFDEKLFIDYVDHEFCLRCVKAGYSIMQVPNALLRHRLGSPTLHRCFGRRIVTTNHSPRRRYYGARNRMYVYWKYFGSYPMWVLRDLRRFMREIFLILMFEHRKSRKMRAIALGILDGVLGRMGPASRAFHDDV